MINYCQVGVVKVTRLMFKFGALVTFLKWVKLGIGNLVLRLILIMHTPVLA